MLLGYSAIWVKVLRSLLSGDVRVDEVLVSELVVVFELLVLLLVVVEVFVSVLVSDVLEDFVEVLTQK